ncbi:aromatic ring-hydroxylating dioxygenase subunit alpha [Variovorax sp. Sphag1AA]|uniref:aromatic ring-hydroxylating dioxygenase subunit alpha n=1 Tax=Variovorax sp. Sphag1AA TaxID=2587027 RepID=UPI00160A1CF0|nr:aromatic ring-hydroxylating dioxygenase subunit alpha [Variovorax sp. Sphag1AA]MBB3181661.1 5,5'-dehydrodivanillate O-demethylase [Variovorax sp. Sphag1AA]
MLTPEKNGQLTEVGPGTPMGEVLRRHWHPIAGIDELERDPVKPVRLMGEDLVLFKDLGGRYGLVDRQCAHRRADLSYGYVEQEGIRCHYHGWQFDAKGACVAQPFEDHVDPTARLRCKVRLKAYEVRPMAGLLWAYMGPQPVPELPDWEAFHWSNGFVQAVFSEVPCNWLQTQENSIDPVHFEWMHANWSRRLRGDDGGYAPAHLQLAFEEFEHGFVYKRISEDTNEQHPLWTIGRVCLWPNGFFLGDHFEWRVPIDDENTLSVTWSFIRVPRESEPFVQKTIPTWHSPIRDAATGRWITSHIINQDIVAWVGQGRIADRTRENLGASDRGIAMLRRRLFEDIDAVQSGRDPKGVLRARSKEPLFLPSDSRDFFLKGLPLADYRRHPKWNRLLTHFIFHAGQPEWVQREHTEAMGVAIEPMAVLDL